MENNTIEILPGFDTPEDGLHGAEFRFVMRRPEAVLTFACYTDWWPQAKQQSNIDSYRRPLAIGIQPAAAEFTFHSAANVPGVDERPHADCPYLPGELCYSMTSHNIGRKLRDILLAQGSTGVWHEMEQQYAIGKRIVNAKERP